MLFAIHDCGFIARLAVEDTGASEARLDKILRLIRESCYSIHDISRVEVSSTRKPKLPRFNMPFEAGLAWGAIHFGQHSAGTHPRDVLLLDAIPHRDKQTLSDLAGQDARIHGNDPKTMVAAVRKFLQAKAPAGRHTRGAEAIWSRYEAFSTALPPLAKLIDISHKEIASFDYLSDWINVMVRWLAKTP